MRLHSSIVMIVPLYLGLTACSFSSLSRSESSGYDTDAEPSTAQEFYVERRIQTIDATKEELGIAPDRELTEREVEAIKSRIELNRLEKGLISDLEKKQYYSLKPYFRSDRERVQFLKLPDHEARHRWATTRGLSTTQTTFDSATNRLIEHNDIARGMTRAAVRQSWGDPDFIEVAGEQIRGNERWRYSKLVSTENGYNNEDRIIYFEGGVVVGWETH